MGQLVNCSVDKHVVSKYDMTELTPFSCIVSGEIVSISSRQWTQQGWPVHYITYWEKYLVVIWCWQNPRCPKTKLVSLALSVFFPRATNSHNISSEGRVKETGYKLLLLHVRELMLGVLLNRRQQQREEEWEWGCTPPPPCKPAVSQPPKPLGLFFFSPLPH